MKYSLLLPEQHYLLLKKLCFNILKFIRAYTARSLACTTYFTAFDLSPHCFSFHPHKRCASGYRTKSMPNSVTISPPTLENIRQATQFKHVKSSIYSVSPKAVSL